MWVEITEGPDWSIGLYAEYAKDDGILMFHDRRNGEPWWYQSEQFRFIPLSNPVNHLMSDLAKQVLVDAPAKDFERAISPVLMTEETTE